MSGRDTCSGNSALSASEFTALMAALGPFERAPHLAVGCSGGGDSLALSLLLGQWVEAQGGRLTALIVDHGIRDEAADEAAEVRGWLAGHGIESEILQAGLSGSTPSLQEAARSARYRLMGDWCRQHGVLHLCVAHHQEDQAETLLLNLTRGSGVDGLSGMTAVAERASYRLLRPLLAVPKKRLENLLAVRGQKFVRDPSNTDTAFKRVRLRAILSHLAREGASAGRLSKAAHRMAEARAELDAAATALLARTVALYPEGYARLDPALLSAASHEIALRALARVVRTVGGKSHPPREKRLVACFDALCESLENGAAFGRTLGGCRLVKRSRDLFVCRETPAQVSVEPAGDKALWDGRFSVSRPCEQVQALVPLGTRTLAILADYKRARIPAPFRHALPVLPGLDGALLLPKLNGVALSEEKGALVQIEAGFQPLRPLSEAPFHGAV